MSKSNKKNSKHYIDDIRLTKVLMERAKLYWEYAETVYAEQDLAAQEKVVVIEKKQEVLSFLEKNKEKNKEENIFDVLMKKTQEELDNLDPSEETRIQLTTYDNKPKINTAYTSVKRKRVKFGPGEELGEFFILIVDRMLTKSNWSGYSDNYMDEFKSSAYWFFSRYWMKFNILKVKGQENKPEHLKTGGFSYFSTLTYSGILAALKILKKEDNAKKEISHDMNSNVRDNTVNSLYTNKAFNF